MKKTFLILLLLNIFLGLMPVDIEQPILYVCINATIISIFVILYVILFKNTKNKAIEESFSTKEFLLISTLAIYQPLNFYVNNVFEIPFWIGILICTLIYLNFLIIFYLAKSISKNKNLSLFTALIVIYLSLNFFRNVNMVNYIGLILFYAISVIQLQKIKKPIIVFASVLLILNSFVFVKNWTKIIKNKILENSQQETFSSPYVNKKSDKNRDIYIILLDQYSGTDILKQKWGFDNSEFINELKKEGFYVFDYMLSNYNTTFASIPSILNLEYIENTPYSTSSSAIENATLYKIAKYNDYNTYFRENIYFNLKQSQYLDNIITNKNFFLITHTIDAFLEKSIYRSIANNNYLTNYLFKQHTKFYLINKSGKKFVFLHMLMPHRPYLYDENGNKAISSRNMEISYLPYLKYANKWTLEEIKKLKSNPKNLPVIIITGDHGMRDPNNFDSYFSTFTAYFNPEQEYSHIQNDKTLINFFIDFTNYEFNTNFVQKSPKIQFVPDPKDVLNDDTIYARMNTAQDYTRKYLK